ncbi:glycosyltransferase family 39 protein [Plantactinospora sp. KBS50]|uniref:glycosyltransferase family 39 protein n=1 Tax=Plantactinospora sp. KBS50 TaxID=2024580 RepID=UPI000BAAF50B|nr:glycosyltransferase family 39 protein [Plantactinospora sp. KBS50]ASW55269.1 hypothetical protein CIK06_15445 [Plantactinospora sp. KBS50]
MTAPVPVTDRPDPADRAGQAERAGQADRADPPDPPGPSAVRRGASAGRIGRLRALVPVLVPALVPGLAMLVVGRYRLRNPSLGWDEHATWAVARRTVPQILHQATHLDGVIAPYYLFVHAWTAIFGDSELALRLPSLLGVAIGVGLAGELGRRLFDPVVGLTGGLFLVAVPQLSRYAQEARPYGFEFLFATLATLLLYAALDRPSWSRWLRYGLAVTLLGWSHVIGLLVLAGHAVVVLSRGRPGRDRAVTRWLCTVPAAVAPVLPLVALGLAQRDRQLAWIGDLTLAQVLNAPGAIFLAPVVGLPLVGLALAARWPRPRPVRDLAALAVLPPALLLAASAPGASMWVPRYVIGVLAPVCLLAAVALRGPVARTVPVALRGSGARTVPVLRIALALLLVVAAAVPTQRAVRGPAARAGWTSGPPPGSSWTGSARRTASCTAGSAPGRCAPASTTRPGAGPDRGMSCWSARRPRWANWRRGSARIRRRAWAAPTGSGTSVRGATTTPCPTSAAGSAPRWTAATGWSGCGGCTWARSRSTSGAETAFCPLFTRCQPAARPGVTV